MRATSKSLIFAGVAVLTNWSYVVKHERQSGLVSINIQFVGLPLFVCLIAAPILLWRIYRMVRDYLSDGVRIPKKERFVDWSPCILLLVLLFHWSNISTGIAADGAVITRTLSYGSEASGATLIASVILIGLFQFYTGLKEAGNWTPRRG